MIIFERAGKKFNAHIVKYLQNSVIVELSNDDANKLELPNNRTVVNFKRILNPEVLNVQKIKTGWR